MLTIHLQQTEKGRGVVSFVMVSRDIAVGKCGNGVTCPFPTAEMGRYLPQMEGVTTGETKHYSITRHS